MAEQLNNFESLDSASAIKTLGANTLRAFAPEVTTIGTIGKMTLSKDGLAMDGNIQSFKGWPDER